LYRHWPDALALLRDALAHHDVPHAEVTGELSRDVEAHLAALRTALERGHLGLVVNLLGERARLDATFEQLRAELTDAGCEPLRRLVGDAVRTGHLPADLDVPAALAELEGPVFYRCMVRREPLTDDAIHSIVRRFLADPPRSRGRKGDRRNPPPRSRR
jgi:hypothetical protein